MLKRSQGSLIRTNKKCEFGCGRLALFSLRSGKFCCSDFSNKCEKIREKNSLAKKGIAPSDKCLKAAQDKLRGSRPWNTGLTKGNDERLKKMSDVLLKKIESGDLVYKGHAHTDETKRKLSDAAVARGFGGYQPTSGRGKKGWYKGFWCDSSWELAYIIYNLEHGIKFERNTQKFEYEYQGKIKRWIPDFIESDGYVEIKGYKTEQVEAKIKSFKNPLKVLMKDQLTKTFDYVINKYGKDYTKLYE